MGKIKFIIILLIIGFLGCSKNSEKQTESFYTENQIRVFDVLKGHWYDTQFSQIVNGQHVNSTKISFGDIYEKPYTISNGETYIYTRHGDCRFTHPYNGVGVDEEYVQCGFYVSPDGKTLDLRYNENNKLFHYYAISIVNNKEIHLHQNGLSLPYIFIKMENEPK